MKPFFALFHRRNLLINRNFALLWVGNFISRAGDIIFDTTLVLWVATTIARGQPWAPLAVGGIAFAVTIPVLVVGPLAGVFVDRWDRRRTMLYMDTLRAVLIALLLLAAGIFPLHLPVSWQLGVIYLVSLLASICSQFFNPAYMGLVGAIVDEADQVRANSRLQMAFYIALIAGPPLGALLFFAVGAQLAILLNALSFIASFLALLWIHTSGAVKSEEEEPKANFLREFGEGLRFFASSRVLMTLLITIVIVLLGESAFSTLGVFFITQNLHTPVSLYGLMNTAAAIGLVAGTVVSNAIARRVGLARMYWLSLVVSGAVILCYARMTSFFPALVALFLYGALVALQNMTIMPLILHVTPQRLMGRTMAVFNPVGTLADMLAVVLASSLATVLRGFHADLLGLNFGPLDTIFLGAGVVIILSGLCAMVTMRDVTLPAKAEAESKEASIVPSSTGEM